MTYYRFSQIKRYFHVSAPDISRLSTAQWHTKLEPLASLLRTKFQEYIVLGQNVSFNEMMVPFSRRPQHIIVGLDVAPEGSLPFSRGKRVVRRQIAAKIKNF